MEILQDFEIKKQLKADEQERLNPLELQNKD